MQDYKEIFKKLLAQTRPMDQARLVSCFVGGLREPIRTDVRANKPNNLSSSTELAQSYEVCDLTQK